MKLASVLVICCFGSQVIFCQSLTFTQIQSGIQPGTNFQVEVRASNPMQFVGIGAEMSISDTIATPPYVFTIPVPANYCGILTLTAFGKTLSGTTLYSEDVSVRVQCNQAASMAISPANLIFRYVGQRLPVVARLMGYDRTFISPSAKSMIFESSNEQVAHADTAGFVVATGPGTAVLEISFSDLTGTVNVMVPKNIRGDLDGDGDVDQDDLNILTPYINTPASNNSDARDLNQDGVIDQRDVDYLKSLCTYISCATQPAALGAVNVTVASSQTSLSFSIVGTGCQPGSYISPMTLRWIPGSSCTVTFATTQSGSAGTQYVFTGWGDGGILNNPRTFSAPTTASTYTANFKKQYWLTTQVSPPSAGLIVPSTRFIDAGSLVSVSAMPNAGYAFNGFSGALSGTLNPQNLTVNEPATVTANFVTLPDLTVLKTHVGGVGGHFSQGQIGATYTLTVSNIGIAASSGPVLVKDTIPGGMTLVSMTGTGWTCGTQNLSNICTRSDSVASNGSFAPIAVLVNVDSAAPGRVINMATVSGGGEVNLANDTAMDPTTINAIANVSEQVRVTQTGFVRNRATGIWSTIMTVTNSSGAQISGPVQVVLANLSSGATMVNNTGIRNGSPYITVSAGVLAAAASVEVSIQFTNPSNGFITFTPVIDSGVF